MTLYHRLLLKLSKLKAGSTEYLKVWQQLEAVKNLNGGRVLELGKQK